MQIESILIFIVFVVISSFANKRKEAQQKQRQQQKREVQTQATQARPQATQARPQATQAKQQKPVKRTLQDLFREMQQEMETEYKKVSAPSTQQKIKPVATYTNESTDPPNEARDFIENKPIKPSFVNKKSPVYRDEIKDQSEVGFDMTEEAILNGIIFSEVIGKPKAMRS